MQFEKNRSLAAFGLALAITGCVNAAGPEAAGPEAAASRGAALRERLEEHVAVQGGQIFEALVNYRGGPGESWVVLRHNNRPVPPELEAKPGLDQDDKDVEPLAPSPGAWAVPLRAPDWCESYDGSGQRLDFRPLEKGYLEIAEPVAMVHDLWTVAVAACDRKLYAPRQRRVQRLLQAFVNATKVPPEQLSGMLRTLVKPNDASKGQGCGEAPLTRLLLCPTAEAKARAKVEGPPPLDALDRLELAGKLDDTARLSLVLREAVSWQERRYESSVRVTGRSFGFGSAAWVASPGTAPGSSRSGVRPEDMLAIASLDAERVAWPEARRRVVESEPDPVLRFLVGLKFDEAKAAAERAMTKGNRDQARAAADTWREQYKAQRDAFDLAFAAIATPTPPACAKVEASFGSLVTSKAPRSFAQASALVEDPAVHLTLAARQACHQASGDDAIARIEKAIVDGARERSGPRRAAAVALHPSRHAVAVQRPDGHPIASVHGCELRFKPTIRLEPRERCVETNKVDSINSRGEIVYRSNCTPLPPLKHTEPVAPVTTDKAVADALSAGSFVSVVTRPSAPALVVSAYPSEQAAESDSGLRVFLGVVLP